MPEPIEREMHTAAHLRRNTHVLLRKNRATVEAPKEEPKEEPKKESE